VRGSAGHKRSDAGEDASKGVGTNTASQLQSFECAAASLQIRENMFTRLRLQLQLIINLYGLQRIHTCFDAYFEIFITII
jgi:hypothetical protein